MDNYNEQSRTQVTQVGSNPKVEILAVGGYGQLIANMTVILYDKKMIIIDSGKGFKIPKKLKTITPSILSTLKSTEAKFQLLDSYFKKGYKLQAIFITHCHADHLGGYEELVKNLNSKYAIDKDSLTVYTTSYTHSFASRSTRFWPKDSVIVVKDQTQHQVDEYVNFSGFLLNHSSLHSLALYFQIHNKRILFLPDHRTDYTTRLGPSQLKIDRILKKINESKPDLIILEGTQLSSKKDMVCQTQSSVGDAIKNLICFKSSSGSCKTIIVSTYGTNPQRVVAVLEAAKMVDRKVFVLGRGMKIGVQAAIDNGLIDPDLSSVIEKNSNISMVNQNKNKYVVLTTGHMGEDKAGLSKMLRGEFPYVWSRQDLVIISSTTIPKEGPLVCRSYLRSSLYSKRLQFYDGDNTPQLHASGHISYKDFFKYFVMFDKPKRIIINHGDLSQTLGVYSILEEARNYTPIPEDRVLILKDGDTYQV